MATLLGSPWLQIRSLSDLQTSKFKSILFSNSSCFFIKRSRRNFSISATSEPSSSIAGPIEGQVRVRFAPSPTGNLHVGGARTALFNYLFARSNGGKFILRIEDTDLERSTRQSEEAVLNDLTWLGLDWDEGPGIGGEFGPYRQSERNSLYKQYAEKLLNSGYVYKCFCSNEELEQMKIRATQMKLPPVYTGKWGSASEEEIEEQLAEGTPYTYRFRVPKEGKLKINDLIRGEVCWNYDTLGDFVILRSNGQPVYNFCVTVDDATMNISHVIRAEEHLPNTLRQALIYKALGFEMPSFAHVSLILAPDRSKLSKRHGATSVGQYKEMGYLPQAVVNYLALLGWGDGTENEFYTIDQLVDKFTIGRVNKSGAIFDSAKLRWMNGQHLRALPSDKLTKMLGDRWKSAGILLEAEGTFVEEATVLLKDAIDLVPECEVALSNLLSYPLHSTLDSDEAKPVVGDKLAELAASLVLAYESGELFKALEEGPAGWKKWVKEFGKSTKRKGKSLFMPLRVLLTGKLHGPDMGSGIMLIYKASRSAIVNPEATCHFNNHQNRSFRSEAALNALYSHNSNTLILYNYPSPSGVYAALFANFYHSTLKDSALVLPFSAVEPLRLIDFKCGRSFETCYLLDFLGPTNFAVQLSQIIPKVVAFDHRQSSVSKLGQITESENIELHMNTCISSARIAYDYFLTRINEAKIELNYIEEIMNDEEKDRVENILKYIEDLDLRKFELPNIEAFRIGIREEMSKFNCVTNPHVFEQLLELDCNDLIAKGESYLNSRQIAANNLLEKAFKIRLGRGKHGQCLAVRADGNSDLSHEICLELSRRSAASGLRPIGAAVFMRSNKNLKMCLRTTDTEVDTSQIAKEYGGGGKPNASSFAIRMDEYNYWTGTR